MATAEATGANRQRRYDDSQAEWHRQNRAAAQDIAPIPKIQKPGRRAKALKSFEYFGRTYFPEQFIMPWSVCHQRAAERVEAAVQSGGKFAFAMPRRPFAEQKATLPR